MTIKISDCHFENCGTGVSAPKDAKLDMSNNKFVACKKAIELRDPPTLLETIGLANNTPLPLVREVFEFLVAGFPDEPAIRTKAESSGLFSWLSVGADTTTVVAGLMQLQQSGLIQAVLAMLPK
ncbi:MAG: hypothetical protein FP813_09725 [Desulfurivibrio sp.]|nr:hypothetical protein [Desulfurivibrio sp.]MBU3937695.1 hypothetical protein [Pseudomonadota bacterium]